MKKNDLKKQSKPESKTDWSRVDAMTDQDIDYSDIPELDDEFFTKALVVPGKKQISIRLDNDVIDWLKKGGKGYQSRVNKLLRVVMEQQQHRKSA